MPRVAHFLEEVVLGLSLREGWGFSRWKSGERKEQRP